MDKQKITQKKIAVLDLETDPFAEGRSVQPFCSGFFDGSTFKSIWGADCIKRTVEMLEHEETEPLIIYAHNGGKFDWLFFYEYLSGDIKRINGRIAQAKLGRHEIRDSYSLFPFALRNYKKKSISYDKFEQPVREKHRAEILDYLEGDCVYLYELLDGFQRDFGLDKLTVGSVAMRELKKLHVFQSMKPATDLKIRRQYYYGGRNQYFAEGIIEQPIRIYDVNSMYPYAMANYRHPLSSVAELSRFENEDTFFITVKGRNHYAFPQRTPDGLDFTIPYGEFSVSIHEYRAAVAVGAFRTEKILKTYSFHDSGTFHGFVDKFYNLRKDAKASGDPVGVHSYKFVLNSAYGKFAQDPANFRSYRYGKIGDEFTRLPCTHCKGTGECNQSDCDLCERINPHKLTFTCQVCSGFRTEWQPKEMDLHDGLCVFESLDSRHLYYHNVATGASITGAARAVLLNGLHKAKRPLYCDTDSIICESLDCESNDKELGAWKLEGQGDFMAIAGKKMYAVFSWTEPPDIEHANGDTEPGHYGTVLHRGKKAWCIKKAHKGVPAHEATPAKIYRAALGETIITKRIVPVLGLDGNQKHFSSRKIQRTTITEKARFGNVFGNGRRSNH